MKNTKVMKPGALYLFKSMSCSNTVYYETLDHTKLFLSLANKYLKDYLYIHEYMLCKDGWIFLARLKSREKIQSAYAMKRKRNNKPAKTTAVWKIVSEQMRLLLAAYVTEYNALTEREGTLVRRPYQRYYFDTVKEAKVMIQRLRRRLVGLQQPKKMYRAKRGHYRIPKKLGKGSIYLSSKHDKRWNKRGGSGRNMLDMAVFQRLTTKVLAKVVNNTIKTTLNLHKPIIPDI